MAKESLTVVRERLAEFLPRLSARVEADGQAGLNNIHKLSEPVIRNLMNTLFGLELEQEKKVNAGGFDLCDSSNHVLVQVTANCTDSKIKDCLRTTADRVAKEAELAGSELYIVFLTTQSKEIEKLRKKTAAKLKKGELKAEGFRFALESGILCLQDFVQYLTDDLGPDGEELTDDQIRKIQNLLDKHSPEADRAVPLLELPFSALGDDAFVGREDKLTELAQKLKDSGNAPILVSGLGGMGKTALVTRFCAGYRGGNAYFVRFRESFTQTVAMEVAAGIPGYKDRQADPDRDYAEAMAILGRCPKGDILIIDNVDGPNDDFGALQTDNTWAKLRKLKLRLILTTRCEVAGAVQLGKMTNETLYRFFENQGLSLEKEQMDALINAVHGHTMTVDLMARTLKRTRTLTVEKLLEALESGNLKDQNYRPVDLERNGKVTQEVIYEHLRRLFKVTKASKEAKAVLRDMVLLPEGGMDIGILEKALGDDAFETLNQQIDHGWLSFDGKSRFVTIHPVVRLVCWKELNPDDENCGAFLDAVWNQYDRMCYRAELIRQCAEVLSKAADRLADGKGKWAIHAGVLWNELGQAKRALHYGQQAVRCLEENNPGSEQLAVAYCNVGSAMRNLEAHRDALEVQQKALQIMAGLGTTDPFVLASVLDNIGTTCGYLYDWTGALEYQTAALKIRENILPPEHPLVAVSYDNVGCTYGNMGKYEQALPFHLKAISIIEKGENVDAAIAYDNVGNIYDALGQYRQALKYKLKALRIFKKLLPNQHPDLAASYSNVGCTYAVMDDLDTALKYMRKAPEALPEGHVKLAEYRGRVNALERLAAFQKQGIKLPNPFRNN